MTQDLRALPADLFYEAVYYYQFFDGFLRVYQE